MNTQTTITTHFAVVLPQAGQTVNRKWIQGHMGGYLGENGNVALRGWCLSQDRAEIERVVALARAKHPKWAIEIRSIPAGQDY